DCACASSEASKRCCISASARQSTIFAATPNTASTASASSSVRRARSENFRGLLSGIRVPSFCLLDIRPQTKAATAARRFAASLSWNQVTRAAAVLDQALATRVDELAAQAEHHHFDAAVGSLAAAARDPFQDRRAREHAPTMA